MMTWLLLALLLAYLIGSLSGSLLLGRLVRVDIRTRGSGNAGGTNAFRTLGWRFALGVVAVDVGKGALAAWLGPALHSVDAPVSAGAQGLACVLAAVAGHTWPLWFGFRGGKGAGTLAGGLLLLWPAMATLLLAVWLGVLTLSGYVGLATMTAAVVLVPLALWLDPPATRLETIVFALAAAAFIVFTHRANIARLRLGTEHRFERARLWSRWFGRGAA